MAEEIKKEGVQEGQVEGEAKVEEAKPEATEAKPEAKTTESTLGEIIEEAAPENKGVKLSGPDMAQFTEIKKDNKELRKELKRLQDTIENGANRTEVAADIKELAKEYDIDENFLNRLATSIRSKAEEAAAERIKPLEEKDRAAKIETVFRKHFDMAMERMPEFEGIVNPEVIKTLSLDPKNAKKTMADLIEETYGNAITGNRTIERTKPGGGKEPQPLDMAKARKDPAYFDEVMADPKLKAEYNERMLAEGM